MVLEWQDPALIGPSHNMSRGRETLVVPSMFLSSSASVYFIFLVCLYSDLPCGEVTKCAGTIADDKEERCVVNN